MRKNLQSGVIGAAVFAVLWVVNPAKSQPPVKIPSSEQEAIVNLQLQVRDLQQAVAKLQQGAKGPSNGGKSGPPPDAGTTPQQVTAPFQVVNDQGKVIFEVDDNLGGQVSINDDNQNTIGVLDTTKLFLRTSHGYGGIALDSQGRPALVVTAGQRAAIGVDAATGAMGLRLSGGGVQQSNGTFMFRPDVSLDLEGGVGNLQFFHGQDTLAFLSATPGGKGAKLQLNDSTGSAGFTAGVSSTGNGFAKAKAGGATASMGQEGTDGVVGFRIRSTDDGPPSGGISLQKDGTGLVYAGTPGVARVKVGMTGDKQSMVTLYNSENKPVTFLQETNAGGIMGVATNDAHPVISLAADQGLGGGGLGVFADAGGTTVLTLGAKKEAGQGDICIIRGDKPGRCLSQNALPLSIAPR